jgi:glycosyltransferase involved in cell wall biosynthesis
MNPLVSICIPVYNGGPYLEACLQSVFLQSLSDFEIIAIDDGSSDSSLKTLQEYASRYPQMKVFANPVNLGLVGNWNHCLELAQGEWIKFVFQDDLLDPECLLKMVEAGRKGGGLIVCRREFLLEENASAELKHYFQQSILTLDSIFPGKVPEYLSASVMSALSVKYLSLNFIGEPSTILFKKAALKEAGLFDARISQICDLEFCLRIATREGMTYVPDTLVQFRVHSASATSSNTTRKRFLSLYSDTAILSIMP